MDRRSKQNHRRFQTRAPSVRFDPIGVKAIPAHRARRQSIATGYLQLPSIWLPPMLDRPPFRRSRQSHEPDACEQGEPVSVCNRTGLCPTEMEIEKWRPETGAQNPPHTDRNGKNCRTETGACQPNPRECRGFSHTGKYHPGDPTAWLPREDSNS
jgi:hypothetical protein